VVDLWVDAALRLGEREMRMMSRLARAQERRMGQVQGEAALAPVEAEPLAMAG
jgi:hypothetical protein